MYSLPRYAVQYKINSNKISALLSIPDPKNRPKVCSFVLTTPSPHLHAHHLLMTQSVPSPPDRPQVPYASFKSFFAGAISGAIAKTAVAPFDRTKILMQVSQMYGWDRYRGSVWDSMKTIWRTEGIPGFFRGNSATVARIMPYAAVQYSSFEFYHRSLSFYVFHSETPSPLKRFIAGAMAGSTSVLATYPIDLARTVLAVQVANEASTKPVRRMGILSTLYIIIKEEGVTSLYRGMYPTLVGVVPYAGISFLTFGVLKRAADRRGISQRAPVVTSLVCGGSAGLCT